MSWMGHLISFNQKNKKKDTKILVYYSQFCYDDSVVSVNFARLYCKKKMSSIRRWFQGHFAKEKKNVLIVFVYKTRCEIEDDDELLLNYS